MLTSRISGSLMQRTALAILFGLGAACTEPPTEPPAAPATSVGTTHKGLSFRQVSAGYAHTCGVTTGNVAYCWGYNGGGALGTGSNQGPQLCDGAPCSTTPVPVAGGLTVTTVSASSGHACAVTTSNAAYCWGYKYTGQLGTGTRTGPETCTRIPCSTRPVPVLSPRP